MSVEKLWRVLRMGLYWILGDEMGNNGTGLQIRNVQAIFLEPYGFCLLVCVVISSWLCPLSGSIHSFEGYILVCGSDCVV